MTASTKEFPYTFVLPSYLGTSSATSASRACEYVTKVYRPLARHNKVWPMKVWEYCLACPSARKQRRRQPRLCESCVPIEIVPASGGFSRSTSTWSPSGPSVSETKRGSVDTGLSMEATAQAAKPTNNVKQRHNPEPSFSGLTTTFCQEIGELKHNAVAINSEAEIEAPCPSPVRRRRRSSVSISDKSGRYLWPWSGKKPRLRLPLPIVGLSLQRG
mmetsp:Transcript_33192/g.65416  ORF Transcript_33192/g.65416 Transcript_33192/m.65416 type:complete len:216 (-) Transcript_33192:755-1402(-)